MIGLTLHLLSFQKVLRQEFYYKGGGLHPSVGMSCAGSKVELMNLLDPLICEVIIALIHLTFINDSICINIWQPISCLFLGHIMHGSHGTWKHWKVKANHKFQFGFKQSHQQ